MNLFPQPVYSNRLYGVENISPSVSRMRSFYIHFDENSGNLRVDPYAFTPNKNRDPDGMSFYREDFATPEQVASDNPPFAGARVARIPVQLLIDLGLSDIVPDPHIEENRPAGHVYVPGLRFVEKKTLSDEERKHRDRITVALAQTATKNGLWSHPNLAEPS